MGFLFCTWIWVSSCTQIHDQCFSKMVFIGNVGFSSHKHGCWVGPSFLPPTVMHSPNLPFQTIVWTTLSSTVSPGHPRNVLGFSSFPIAIHVFWEVIWLRVFEIFNSPCPFLPNGFRQHLCPITKSGGLRPLPISGEWRLRKAAGLYIMASCGGVYPRTPKEGDPL